MQPKRGERRNVTEVGGSHAITRVKRVIEWVSVDVNTIKIYLRGGSSHKAQESMAIRRKVWSTAIRTFARRVAHHRPAH